MTFQVFCGYVARLKANRTWWIMEQVAVGATVCYTSQPDTSMYRVSCMPGRERSTNQMKPDLFAICGHLILLHPKDSTLCVYKGVIIKDFCRGTYRDILATAFTKEPMLLLVWVCLLVWDSEIRHVMNFCTPGIFHWLGSVLS